MSTMDLLPTISSDEEEIDEAVDIAPSTKNKTAGNKQGKKKRKKESPASKGDDGDDSSDDEVDEGFEFGGLLGEDDDGSSAFSFSSSGKKNAWSYKSALDLLARNDAQDGTKPARMDVASIIAAARSNIKKKGSATSAAAAAKRKGKKENDDNDDEEVTESSSVDGEEGDGEDDKGSDDDDNDGTDGDSESDSDDEDDEVDDAHAAKTEMETDVLKVRERIVSKRKARKLKRQEQGGSEPSGQEEVDQDQNDEGEGEEADDDDESKGGEDVSSAEEAEEEEDDEEAKREAAKAAAYFAPPSDVAAPSSSDGRTADVFAQLNLSRPLLRGVASMGFVTPTPVQSRVIPVALAGRDVCASAVTGSGKTAAFLLPIMERILQRTAASGGKRFSGGNRGNNRGGGGGSAATKGLVLTPTRELAAQCLGMMSSIGRYTDLRPALIVGGAKNVQSQAAELRTRPDVVIATPGRLLDHLTNSPGVDVDDLDFLVLDEADRLLDLGFQDEIHEIVRSCPTERQTMLFSATMNTKVDELVKLSLKRPVRIAVSDKKKTPRSDGGGADKGVEVAPRLEQEFVRVRTGNEGLSREGMLLALLTRTFQKRTIVFFDTKAMAHRLMIIAGLCGIQCGELHSNLTQVQRLTALEQFREGDVDVLLATDLAGRGLDIPTVEAVINFEMPSNVETYVHRIGRTARAGRGGKSCTLIGEGRRHLMKAVIKDAEEKSRQQACSEKTGSGPNSSGIIRSRTIPPAVVSHFVAKISSLEPHVEEVLAAEAVARMDRIAEMEATRAKNIIEHSDEIKSRPQREWFASSIDKKSTKEAAAEKKRKIEEKVGTGTHRMTRKKRRMREAREQLIRAQEEMAQEREETGKDPNRVITDKSIKTSARAQKKEEAQRMKENFGMSLRDEDEARDAKRREREKKAGKKKQKGVHASDSLGDGGLFDEEKVAFAKKPKKDAEERARPTSYHFTDFDPNRTKRKGGKKSVKSFKSKSRYKRRK